ncbi:Putative pentatricopeptide repeat-containing protein At5g47460, partial [Linum grandiflorum]
MPIVLLQRALRNLLCRRISTFADASFSVPTNSHQLLIESWITRISSLAQHGSGSEHSLLRASELLNSATAEDSTGYALVHLIRVSTDLGLDSYCPQLHCYVIKCGFTSDVLVSTALMRFYRAMKLIGVAHHVFDEIPRPSVVSWNTLISGLWAALYVTVWEVGS